MERYLGLDVHAASSTLVVLSEAGRRLKRCVLDVSVWINNVSSATSSGGGRMRGNSCRMVQFFPPPGAGPATGRGDPHRLRAFRACSG